MTRHRRNYEWRPRSSRTSGIARTSVEIERHHRHPEPDRHPEVAATTSSCRSTSSARRARGVGLQAVFRSVFPIKDFNETSELVFVSLQPREAEVRRRRVPPARHDLRGADQGDHAAHGLRHPRGRRAHRPRHQGAGGLLRRDPADDRERHLHHQRHRARRRSASCTAARASSSTTTRARPTPAASSSTPRASSPTAARGSTSSSTTRTSSTSASTAAARCTRRCCSRALGYTHAGAAQLLLRHRDRLPGEGRQVLARASSTTCCPASARRATSRSAARSSSRRTASSPAPRSRS